MSDAELIAAVRRATGEQRAALLATLAQRVAECMPMFDTDGLAAWLAAYPLRSDDKPALLALDYLASTNYR
jgi:hypothetical protein